MALSDDSRSFLELLGFDPEKSYTAPKDVYEASLASLYLLTTSSEDNSRQVSRGFIHITGPAVSGHTAPVKTVGDFLINFQKAIDAIGASLYGCFSSSGQLSANITGRTEMSMVASPLPGSVVIQIAPTMKRKDDLYPNGDSLFDLNETGIHPLADLAIGEFFQLINEFDPNNPDYSQFVEHLTELGPRAASDVKYLLETVDRGAIDVDIKWDEPGNDTKLSKVSYTYAKHAAKVIAEANIDSQIIHVIGNLQTATISPKDKLRIKTDEGNEKTISIGSIQPSTLVQLHAGQRVDIEVERRISRHVGGKEIEKLVGISAELIPMLPA